MKQYIISEQNEDQRFSKFLQRILPGAGSGFIYKILRKKNITLNDKKASGNETLVAGDLVKVWLSDETFEKFAQREEISYPSFDPEIIVYEDDNIIIINKPAGMLSQRSSGSDISACELLCGYLIKYRGFTTENFREYRPSAVNRLDRNTTGLLLCAKNLKAASELSAMLKERTVKKEYIALVKGRITGSRHIKGRLLKDENNNTVSVGDEKSEGSFIETSYTALKFCDKLNSSVLLVDLITGKTHQIRAHLASEGYPIVGDPKYGDPDVNRKYSKEFGVKSQLLHACRITFPENDGALAYLSGRMITSEPPFKHIYEDG